MTVAHIAARRRLCTVPAIALLTGALTLPATAAAGAGTGGTAQLAQIAPSNSCLVRPTGNWSGTQQETRVVMVAAWILGVREGAYAAWTKQLRDGEAIKNEPGMKEWLADAVRHSADANASATRMATTLKVSRPVPFGAGNSSTAVSSFKDFVERSGQASARGLAQTYVPRMCQIYKVGAYWGFSTLFRAADPTGRNILGDEIMAYAKALGMPADQIRAMVDPVATKMSSGQVLEASEQLSRRIAEYWNAQ